MGRRGKGSGKEREGEWEGRGEKVQREARLRPLLRGAVYGPGDRGWILLATNMATAKIPPPRCVQEGRGSEQSATCSARGG